MEMKMKNRIERVVEERIIQIIHENMEENSVRAFEEIDSLAMMDLIMDIEDELEISIPLNDIESVKNRDEFVQMIISPLV